MCDTLKRFGVSMERELLAQLDRFVLMKGYQNRSHALRVIVKEALLTNVEEKEILCAAIKIPKNEIDTRLGTIINRCEHWGIIRSMTTIFSNQQTVTIYYTMELPRENISHLQVDPILQPLTIYSKGSVDFETDS